MNFSALNNSCAVKEHAIINNRHAYQSRYIEIKAKFHEFKQRGFSLIKQNLLLKQVLTSVSSDGKFGQTKYFNALSFSRCHHSFNLLYIKSTIGNLHRRDGRRYFNKTVLHKTFIYIYKVCVLQMFSQSESILSTTFVCVSA